MELGFLSFRIVVLVGLILIFPARPSHAHGTHSSLLMKIDRELATQPENGRLWFKRAMLEFQHEDWDGALIDLENAERQKPNTFPTLWWRGMTQEKQGKLLDAKRTLDDFVKSAPKHSGGLASRARVELKLDLTVEALDDFRVALANRPDAEPDLVQEVAQALAANGKSGEAVEILETALSKLGAVPSLQLSIITIEMTAGRHDAALARLDEMQRAAPRSEPWMEKRAALLAEAGRIEDSRAAWQALINHLKGLPDQERHSNSMVLASERARQAISMIDSIPRLQALPQFNNSPPRP